jgi:hypothetical protein
MMFPGEAQNIAHHREPDMATRDILTLRTPMAEGIIRLLYTIALILIAIGVLMGLARGVMIMTHAPMQRPAITAPVTPQPGAATPQTPQNDAQNVRPWQRGEYRGWHRFGHHHRHGMMMGRSPMIFGLFMIVRALLGGFIALMVVRVLAEMGLSVLAMPRRATA